MGAARHLVARQTVEIVAADRAQAEALAARTSSAAGRLAGAVERSLDRVAAAGLDWRIDRLELDLGPCDPARWEDALADGIGSALAAKVAEAVDRGEAVRRDPAAAALLLLAEFARSGRLPWWAAGDTPAGAVAALVAAGCDPLAVRAILATTAAIERLVHQLDEPSLAALVRLARPELDERAAAAIPAFAGAVRTPGEAGAVRLGPAAVWHAILAEAALADPASPRVGTPFSPGPPADPSARFHAAVARRLGIDKLPNAQAADPRMVQRSQDRDEAAIPPASALRADAPAAPLPERLRALALRHPSAAAALGGLAALAPRLDARTTQAVEAVLDRVVGPSALPALVDLFLDGGAIPPGEADRWRDLIAATAADPRDEAHDAIAVADCGLVLLWPFLPRFFGGLGLLEGEHFRGRAAQHRAAALLHHLAGGGIACPEQELPLAKVLAGIDIDAVHAPGEPLDVLETAAAGELLEAVLGHAPMLGRISTAGLREAFLLRPGLLSTRDGHWLLRAERRSIDVLLDRLPWTFAWVRLPWMPEPLQVEW